LQNYIKIIYTGRIKNYNCSEQKVNEFIKTEQSGFSFVQAWQLQILDFPYRLKEGRIKLDAREA